MKASLPSRDERERERIDHVLLPQHARREGFFRIRGQYRHRGLGDDRAGIEFRRYIVHRAAVNPHAGLEGAAIPPP